MEIVILVAIWSVMVKRGVEDIIHAARGNTPHRYTAARKPAKSGAWGRYWRTLSDDVAADLLDRHNRNRERRTSQPPKPTLADRWKYGRMAFRYARWNAHNRFKRAWAKRDEKRRARTDRTSPEPQTVPGEVVPNWDGGRYERQDEHQDDAQDRPEDEPGPDIQDGQDETGTGDQDEQPIAPSDQQDDEYGKPMQDDIRWHSRTTIGDLKRAEQGERTSDEHTANRTTTQEGTPTMTATTTEVVGLSQTIRFCEDSAAAFRAQAQATEQTAAAVAAGDVSGPAAAKLAHAMELSLAAAAAMDEAAAEFRPQLGIQEQYNANPGAGTREFVTAGQ